METVVSATLGRQSLGVARPTQQDHEAAGSQTGPPVPAVSLHNKDTWASVSL